MISCKEEKIFGTQGDGYSSDALSLCFTFMSWHDDD